MAIAPTKPIYVDGPPITAKAVLERRFRTGSDVTTTQYLWHGTPNIANPPKFYITSGAFKFKSGSTSGSTGRTWTCTTTSAVANKHYDILIEYDFSASAGAPTITINGVAQSLSNDGGTVTNPPNGLSSHVLDGYAYSTTESDVFLGVDETFHVWPGMESALAWEAAALTSKPTLYFPERVSGGYHFYFEQIAPGQSFATAVTVRPNATGTLSHTSPTPSWSSWEAGVGTGSGTDHTKVNDQSDSSDIRAAYSANVAGTASFPLGDPSISGYCGIADFYWRVKGATSGAYPSVKLYCTIDSTEASKTVTTTSSFVDHFYPRTGQWTESIRNAATIKVGRDTIAKNTTVFVSEMWCVFYDNISIKDTTGSYSVTSRGGTGAGSWITRR